MVEADGEDAAAPSTVLLVRGKAPEDREECLRCTSKVYQRLSSCSTP
jgi:hypothetical protein